MGLTCPRRVTELLLVAVLILPVASCGLFESPESGRGGGDGGKVLNDYAAGDISALDSTTATDGYSFNVLNNFMEGLYRLDENEQPRPAMAADVQISADERTYTFTLRGGIKWSNGEPVTSEDFRYAWLRAMHPETAGSYAFILSDFIEGAAAFAEGEGSERDVAIETPDEKTLRVTLDQPTPFFLSLTAFPTYFPLKREFVERRGEKYAQSAEDLLSNGPFEITRFEPTSQVILERNDHYWDRENVDLGRVNLRIIKDSRTALNLYQSGALDVVALDSENVDRFRDSPDFTTERAFETLILYMNTRDRAIANENIRKALQRGFDRRSYVDSILGGVSEPAYGLVPPGMSGPRGETFREFAGNVIPDFDAQAARELYERGVEELGEEPTISVSVSDSEISRDTGVFLQGQWEKNLGADIEVNVLPFDALLERSGAGDFQISASTWIADFNDPINYLDLFTSDSSFNDGKYASERYDELIARSKRESGKRRRMELLRDAERLLLKDAAISPVYYAEYANLVKPYVRNYESHPSAPSTEYKYVEIEQ